MGWRGWLIGDGRGGEGKGRSADRYSTFPPISSGFNITPARARISLIPSIDILHYSKAWHIYLWSGLSYFLSYPISLINFPYPYPRIPYYEFPSLPSFLPSFLPSSFVRLSST